MALESLGPVAGAAVAVPVIVAAAAFLWWLAGGWVRPSLLRRRDAWRMLDRLPEARVLPGEVPVELRTAYDGRDQPGSPSYVGGGRYAGFARVAQRGIAALGAILALPAPLGVGAVVVAGVAGDLAEGAHVDAPFILLAPWAAVTVVLSIGAYVVVFEEAAWDGRWATWDRLEAVAHRARRGDERVLAERGVPRWVLAVVGAGLVAAAIVIGVSQRAALASGTDSDAIAWLLLLAIVLLVLGVVLVLATIGGPWRTYAEPVLDAVGELGPRRVRVRLTSTPTGLRMAAAGRVVAIPSADLVDVVRSGQHVVVVTGDRAYVLGGMRIVGHPAIRELEAGLAARSDAVRPER